MQDKNVDGDGNSMNGSRSVISITEARTMTIASAQSIAIITVYMITHILSTELFTQMITDHVSVK